MFAVQNKTYLCIVQKPNTLILMKMQNKKSIGYKR